MEVTVEDTCGSWSRQHLLLVASGGGLGMSHCPAMRLSHRAGSSGTSPISRSYKGPLRRAPHPHPTPRPSLVLVVGPRLSPRSLAWAWVSVTYVKSHH